MNKTFGYYDFKNINDNKKCNICKLQLDFGLKGNMKKFS